ncbi:hypothetical protein FNL39_10324 [Nocardia caishijiensis]|uniref:Uncharacterized protein n=1 Tax=Nocardia caishijiensis TaxID=184756 RepID=A0ABQ6YMU7_9NOCA|nr:hypothetical protein FNL39_10324 [Nocardia caishijiensis]
MSITFSRMPIGVEMGIEAEGHLSDDGIAAGAAVLYDADGAFGMCTSTLADESHQIRGASSMSSPTPSWRSWPRATERSDHGSCERVSRGRSPTSMPWARKASGTCRVKRRGGR